MRAEITTNLESIVPREVVVTAAIGELNQRAKNRLGLALYSAVGGVGADGMFGLTELTRKTYINPPLSESVYVGMHLLAAGTALGFAGVGLNFVRGAIVDKRYARDLYRNLVNRPLADMIPKELAVRIGQVALETHLNGAAGVETKQSLLHATSITLPEGTPLPDVNQVHVVTRNSLNVRETLEDVLQGDLKTDDATILDTSFIVSVKHVDREKPTVFHFADRRQWEQSGIKIKEGDVITRDALIAHNGDLMNEKDREVSFQNRKVGDSDWDERIGVSAVGVRYPECIILDREVWDGGDIKTSHHELVVGLTDQALLSLVGIGNTKP